MNPEDPTRIMTCTLNERLQGQRVTVSNLLVKGVPISGSLTSNTKNSGMQ